MAKCSDSHDCRICLIPESDAPTDGQVVVRNEFVSVDPYMRGRMNDVKSYSPPFAVGAVMDGGAVGVVVESKSEDLAVGDKVQHQLGWRDLVVGDARTFRKVDDSVVSLSAYLGALGMTGLTAYAGLRSVASLKEGEIVFVSGAAGAVGSAAGQLAKRASIRGFLVADHFDVAADFERDVAGWLADGSVTFRETIVDGIDNAPDAFIGMLRGDNIGKMLVRIDQA